MLIIQAGDQNGEEVVLALLHRLGLGAGGGGRGDILRRGARRVGPHLGLADEAGVDPGQDRQDENDQQDGAGPASPPAALAPGLGIGTVHGQGSSSTKRGGAARKSQ